MKVPLSCVVMGRCASLTLVSVMAREIVLMDMMKPFALTDVRTQVLKGYYLNCTSYGCITKLTIFILLLDDFLCKDKRRCIEGYLVCDGRAHCLDGSDEMGCPTMAAKTSTSGPLKCRVGSKPCKDGRECVLYTHVCDGERDCKDGSDERGCEYKCKAGKTHEADS